MQDDFLRLIAKDNVIKFNTALQFGVGYGAVGLMGMFPCPDASAFLAFGQSTVGILVSIDQGDIAVVYFGRFVNQVKDSFSAGQSIQDAVDLLRNLGNRLREATDIL